MNGFTTFPFRKTVGSATICNPYRMNTITKINSPTMDIIKRISTNCFQLNFE